MLFSISSLGLLALLFLAQSPPARSDFVCNDMSVQNATQGYCLRKVVSPWDNNNPILSNEPTPTYLGIYADKTSKDTKRFPNSNIFSCYGKTPFGLPTTVRACCNFDSPSVTGFGLTTNEILKGCVGR